MSEEFFTSLFIPKKLNLKNQDGYIYGSTHLLDHDNSHPDSEVVIVVSNNDGNITQNEEKIGCFGKCNCNNFEDVPVHLNLDIDSHKEIKLIKLQINNKNISLESVIVINFNVQDLELSELINKTFDSSDSCLNPYSISYLVSHVKKRYVYHENIYKYLSKNILICLLHILCVLNTPLRYFVSMLKSLLRTKVNYKSTSVEQIHFRLFQLEQAKIRLRERREFLLTGRLLGTIICDIILGITLMVFIFNYVTEEDVYHYFRCSMKIIVTNVNSLLEWLKGAPAGLKLNQPLTQTLAAFFSYHIHLWNLYLEMAQPVLKGLAWILVWTGMYGISIQISILSDLLDLATFHLYCFYVYAARIHMVQVSLLESHWRAFRGKKWNPLKNRIDTYDAASSSSLSRVLMAVIFTLVVFLLPTTTVYYLVFMSLRLLLYFIQGILSFLIWILNSNPIYVLILNIIDSSKIKGEVYFQTLPIKEKNCNTPLYLNMSSTKSSLSKILSYCSKFQEAMPKPRWNSIFSSIIYGKYLL